MLCSFPSSKQSGPLGTTADRKLRALEQQDQILGLFVLKAHADFRPRMKHTESIIAHHVACAGIDCGVHGRER